MSTSSTTEPQHSPQKQVSYCINPSCQQRQNPDNLKSCQACGTPLLIKDRYRLVSPLRPLDENGQAELFEVEDLGVEAVRGERYKVVKVLLKANDSNLVDRLPLTMSIIFQRGFHFYIGSLSKDYRQEKLVNNNLQSGQ